MVKNQKKNIFTIFGEKMWQECAQLTYVCLLLVLCICTLARAAAPAALDVLHRLGWALLFDRRWAPLARAPQLAPGVWREWVGVRV